MSATSSLHRRRRITDWICTTIWWWLMATFTKITAQVQQSSQRLPLRVKDNIDYNSDFITLPLIPHREQQRRRQRELNTLDDNLPQTDLTRRRYIPPSLLRRTASSSALSPQVVAAVYQGLGTHYVDLWCGTPTPQRQTVIVDTGSGVTAFPCVGCKNCGDDGHHIDHVYNQSASKSLQKLTCDKCQKGHCHTGHKECEIGMTYQEGSAWSAYEVVDTCYAGGPHDVPLSTSSKAASLDDADPRLARSFAFPMTFGCQTRLTGLFKTQLADGIMGMDNAETSFWYQMHQAGKIPHKMFSLCYSRQTIADRQGTNAGAMTLGGSDSRLHTTPMVYAALKPGDIGGWYAVHIRRVYLQKSTTSGDVDGTAATTETVVVPLNVSEEDWNQGNSIVDSGTTSTYLSSVTLEYWNQIWQDVTGAAYYDTETPVKLTREELDQLPTILFQIKGDATRNSQISRNTTTAAEEEDGGMTGLAASLDPEHPFDVILAIPPSHYMEYDETSDQYLASLIFVDRKEHEGNVLGANAMMEHDVLFDVDNLVLGLAESHCDYRQLLQSAHIPTGQGHVALKSCDTLACQGPIIVGLLGVLVLGLCVGRSMGRARRREYQITPVSELELSNNLSNATTEGRFVEYRDEPGVAAETQLT